MRRAGRVILAGIGLLVLFADLARAQTPPTPPPTTSGEDEQFTIRDSSVGYIDSAIPANQVRLRYDSAYHFTRPNRAEFFYGPGSPNGPGLEDPERSVDYQEVSAYLEVLFGPRLSFFAEVPVRFLNPEVNDNAAGLSDVNAGFKFAFIRSAEQVVTFQLRVIAPTGDVNTGLSTTHATLEPALLYYRKLSERLTLEGEFRFWAPVGGTDFAGDVLRYGAGLSYDLCRTEHLRFRPVAEFVGWTLLSGKETFTTPSGALVTQDSAGEEIVNVKLGMRTAIGDRLDFYAGYGRPLTGTRWYENIVRVELRWAF
jgi:Putative MetA-pathway of phenol degradation